MNYVFTFDATDLPGELLPTDAADLDLLAPAPFDCEPIEPDSLDFGPACVDCGGTDGQVLRWETDDGRIEYAHWPACQPKETPHAELATVAA